MASDPNNRLHMLMQLVGRNPNDAFMRYGLAMEYAKHGNFDKAMENFSRIWELDPDYAPAYYHGGLLLAKMGKMEDARQVLQAGIQVTTRTGDDHTRSELEAALEELLSEPRP